ncbi:MAG: hypothetical protein MUC49_14765 [Raineya sp.]|jgi:hypothetical protein|nr:hypothetical protein [Raineya sp.]
MRNNSNFLDTKAFRLILIVVIAYFVFSWLDPIKWFKDLRKNLQEGKVGKEGNQITTPQGEKVDIDAIAVAMRNAMNPSGQGWMIGFDGTKEEALYLLAEKSRGNFDKIAKAYKNRNDSDLMSDLQGELEEDELLIFQQKAGLL